MTDEGEYPDELLYHREHDWARVDDQQAELGITWYAQHALGDVVFYDPPEVGDMITANESYGELESVKAVSDLIAPVSGEVVAVNQDVVDKPESLNEHPYEAWLIRVRLSSPAELDTLMSAEDYRSLIAAS